MGRGTTMGVLQDFERRLEGAVEGVFARMFRSGLQPIELAKALQRYARDTQHVSNDGTVVPNVYRFHISRKDHERLTALGVDLPGELAAVVVGTAAERSWLLRGPVVVRVETGEKVRVGRYELTGRIESVEATPPPPAAARPTPAQQAAHRADQTQVLGAPPAEVAPTAARRGAAIRVLDATGGQDVPLAGRTLAGRGPTCAVLLTDTTVSREHAAFVRREDSWWVVDLGSTNGTRVNGTTAAEHPLQHGDRVTLGDAALEFVEG